jgi:hypothetical protein
MIGICSCLRCRTICLAHPAGWLVHLTREQIERLVAAFRESRQSFGTGTERVHQCEVRS